MRQYIDVNENENSVDESTSPKSIDSIEIDEIDEISDYIENSGNQN